MKFFVMLVAFYNRCKKQKQYKKVCLLLSEMGVKMKISGEIWNLGMYWGHGIVRFLPDILY